MNDPRPPVKRRRLMLVAASAVLLGAAGAALAQPGSGSAPLKIIVPFTPGTTPDLIARLLDPKISQRLGRPVIVENKPGASGILGMEAVSKAAPDGSTIMIGTSTALTLPFFYSKLPFDVIQSFQPIAMIGHTNFAVVAHPSVPASNAKELVAYLKKNPGKLTYGSPGKGTFHHLVMEQFGAQSGTRLTHVPYKGSAGMFADLTGGHINLGIMPLHVAVPMEAAGKLKIVGATRGERDRAFPKVATLRESGLASLDVDAWYAVWGPKGMPKEQVLQIKGALQEALGNEEVRSKLDQQGVNIKFGGPDDLLKTARTEYEHWGRVIKAANIQPE